MIYFILILFLICHFDSCLSWFLENKSTCSTKLFRNAKEIRMAVKVLKWNHCLQIFEDFTIIKSTEKMEYPGKINGLAKSFLTLVKYSHYENLISNFGKILFDKEMKNCKMISILFHRKMNYFKISWMTLDRTNSTLLIIQKLFKKHFPFLERDDLYHMSLPIFKRIFLFHRENVEIMDKARIFKDQGNLLQIYSKKNAKFNGSITLICPLNPLLHPLIENSVLGITMKDIKDFSFGRHIRFGAYISKENFSSKTFAFYQSSSTNSNEINLEKIKEFKYRGFSLIDVYPIINFTNLNQFLDFITDLAFHRCQ